MNETKDVWENKPTPEIDDKIAYLRLVNAEDCIKDLVTGLYSLQLQHSITKRTARRKQNGKPMMKNCKTPTKEQQKFVDRKEDINKQWWSTSSDSDSSEEDGDSDLINVPFHYKKYNVEDRKVMVKQPEQLKVTQGISYDGPEDTKKIDLAQPWEDPKIMYIGTDLDPEEEQKLIELLLQDYRDVLAWSFKDLKGVDLAIYQHTIPLRDDAKPSKQRPYSYNDNFAAKT